MSFNKNSKTLSAVAALGATAMLLIGSLSSASAAENKSSDSKESKPVCVEGQRNIGTVLAPICVANGASAYEIAVKLGFTPANPVTWIASLKGEKGDQGLVGPVGPQGATGPQGVSGDVGPRGEQGVIGLTGLQGTKGDKGDTGAAGAAGAKGDKGDTGAAGADANAIGTACSFDTGSGEHAKHHTGVWGFDKINNGFAAYGCILAGTDQGDD